MDLLKFMRKKKRASRKHKKHAGKVAAGKGKTKPQPGEIKLPKVSKGKEMILSPGKDAAPLFIASASKGETIESEDPDTQYLVQRVEGGAELLSYVYILPAGKGRPLPIVDLTVDGVWAFVKEASQHKFAKLEIEDVNVSDVQTKTKDGKELNLIRVVAKCVDKNTGLVHFSVKEEARTKKKAKYEDGKYAGKEIYYDHHASTMAMEKAQKKAIVSHPNFPRLAVREFLKQQLLSNAEQLKKLGFDPDKLLPSGGIKAGRSKFSDVFEKGKKAGLTTDETRKAVAGSGKPISGIKTAKDMAVALTVIDGKVVNTKTGEIKETPLPAGPTVPDEKPPVAGQPPKPAKRFLANVKFPDNIPDDLAQHLEYALPFGKYKEQSLKQILETNADYLRWFSDDCQGKIDKGEELSGFGKVVLVHLNPVFKFLKDNGLVKTENTPPVE